MYPTWGIFFAHEVLPCRGFMRTLLSRGHPPLGDLPIFTLPSPSQGVRPPPLWNPHKVFRGAYMGEKNLGPYSLPHECPFQYGEKAFSPNTPVRPLPPGGTRYPPRPKTPRSQSSQGHYSQATWSRDQSS